MKRIIGIILIIVGVAAGAYGISNLNESGGGLEIGDVEIAVENTDKRNTSYAWIGGGVVCLIAGIYVMSKRT